MIVNRVFCYSKDVAKQNRNRLPILELVLTIIIFFVASIGIGIFLKNSMVLFMIMIFVFLVFFLYFIFILDLRLKSRMSGWATTNDNRIFKAMVVNNGLRLYSGGIAAGSMVDQLTNSTKDVGVALGVAGLFYSMNRQAQYMSHPEIIAKMVESAPNITGAEVIEILKVYSIKERNHSIKVKCDYKTLRTDRIKHNRNLDIEKSYNQLNDLISAINLHR